MVSKIMDNYRINLPSYSAGANSYADIVKICEPYGSKVIAIGGRKAIEKAKGKILSAIEGSALAIESFVWYGGEATFENVDLLIDEPDVAQADMIFAIGGGKALDTCKCLGEKLQKPVFTFPTIASTCAATTAVSTIYKPDGTFLMPYFLTSPPEHAFIDTEIISQAPPKYIWAGMGDTYAKYFESSVSSRDDRLVHYHELGVTIGRMCCEPVMKYGKTAMDDIKNAELTYEVEQIILAVIVTTGIAAILLTADRQIHYNTGLAHAVNYALTVYPHIERKHLHGEIVGFGCLVLLLADGQLEEFKRLYAFNKSIGLPVSIEDIEISKEQLAAVIPQIAKMPDVAHNPYEVTEQLLTDAFNALEEFNARQKGVQVAAL